MHFAGVSTPLQRMKQINDINESRINQQYREAQIAQMGQTITLPEPPSLVTTQGSRDSAQLTAWSATYVNSSGGLSIHDLRLRHLEPDSITQAGARIFERK